MMVIKKIGQWEQAQEALSARTIRRFRAAQRYAVKQEAKHAHKMLINALRKRAPGGKKLDRLARSTLVTRRFLGIKGTRPLIASQSFINSIKVLEAGGDAWFIGIPKTAKNSKGKNIARIIEFQERGGTIAIRLTPKIIAFLRAAGVKRRRKISSGGRRVMIIRIKPRPVFKPAEEQYKKKRHDAESRVAATISKRLHGLYGFAR